MSEIKNELNIFEKKEKFPFSKRQMIFAAVVLGLGFYIGNILYGTNNLLSLLSLQEERSALQDQVKYLNVKNAELLKSYFEMIVIEGQK